MRGRGRGRGHALSCVLNKNPECQKQQQLSETVTNTSTIIQNPVELPKDYSLLPLLAAAPKVGEKIAFKLLELTSDYSPDFSDYKEGKLLSHNPETQQVDIEILPSLPAVKEPGKCDLVYHSENGTEVVQYAVTQERRITVFWRELIDPRLIIEPPSNTSKNLPRWKGATHRHEARSSGHQGAEQAAWISSAGSGRLRAASGPVRSLARGSAPMEEEEEPCRS
ncbi:Coilin [Heterocephalus glaber]|uniref:Coilin n=1 Tax=Heterocephalus glaber TaxID=10181 RepID=G5BF74_HETGA|nr:Coilin [Heterocephalus glaber]